jgi:hypothetical protein
MADIKISGLNLIDGTTVPPLGLEDEIIVNDVDVGPPITAITKRTTLQAIRDLANENIDDTPTGSEVTGDLNVTGDLTVDGLINGIDITELEASLVSGAINCARDSVDADGICGLRILGDTVIDSDLTVRGTYFGDGGGLTNIQYALRSDSADHARLSKFIEVSPLATAQNYYLNMAPVQTGETAVKTDGQVYFDKSIGALFAPYFSGDGSLLLNVKADSADHARVSKFQEVAQTGTGTYYPLMAGALDGVDSVNTNSLVTYNTVTEVFSAPFFSGDGSLLTNITAAATINEADKIKTKQATLSSLHYLTMVETTGANATADSALTDNNLLYDPINAIIQDPSNSLFGAMGVTYATQTTAKTASGVNYMMMRETSTGQDSVSTITDLTYNTTTNGGTLFSPEFSGGGAALTDVDAVTAITATNVDVTADTANTVNYLMFSGSTAGGNGTKVNSNIRVNPGLDTMHLSASGSRMLIGADSDISISVGTNVQYSFNVTNNGSTDYVLSDPGNVWFPTSENDPILYLRRGDTYRFDHDHSGHPFEIRVSNGGGAYTTGVSVISGTSQIGITQFKVPMSAPATLYYQCTAHSGMGNTINIV